MHPGHDLAEIRQSTGFDFDHVETAPRTALPDEATLALLRGRVLDELAETYPDFAEQMRLDLGDPAPSMLAT